MRPARLKTRGHCRFPRSSARTAATATRACPHGQWPPPAIERAAPQQLARGTDLARRLACGVRMAWGHESRDHVELARTRVPAVPSRPRGVVVPRLERAPATLVD